MSVSEKQLVPMFADASALRSWVRREGVEPPEFYRLLLVAADVAAREGWRMPSGRSDLRRLTKLALAEFSGRLADTERQDVVGIAEWSETWASRYQLLLEALGPWVRGQRGPEARGDRGRRAVDPAAVLDLSP